MFNKKIVSVVLGVSLLTSLSLGAKDNKPTVIAKLDVENQLSISAHQAGKSNFINQIGESGQKSAKKEQTLTEVPMSVVSIFWTMAFALLFFVVRVSARRIK
ncbi:MAG: hypothetical protein ACSHWN_01700 [Methylophilaceae bacterium]